MKKLLVKCPSCELGGTVNVLGEIDENGNFAVLRFHKGSTIISGDNLKVTCGNCGEIVYRKEAKNDNNISVQWESRIYRGTFNPLFAGQGTQS